MSALAGLGTDPELPLLRRTEPVVLYFDTRDQQLDDYGIRDAWRTTRGEGSRIAIIDTGIDATSRDRLAPCKGPD